MPHNSKAQARVVLACNTNAPEHQPAQKKSNAKKLLSRQGQAGQAYGLTSWWQAVQQWRAWARAACARRAVAEVKPEGRVAPRSHAA